MASTGAVMDKRRLRLKAVTESQHSALDAMVTSGRLLETVQGYRRYLSATLLARRQIEARLTLNGAADIDPSWPRRQIANLVEADLADLTPEIPESDAGRDGRAMSAGSVLGALYVLEGSAMGARLIARRVMAIGMGPEFGARHLNRQAGEPQAWPRFLALLEAFALTGPQDDDCLREAVATFECFRSHYEMAA